MVDSTEPAYASLNNIEDIIRIVDKNGRWQYGTAAKASLIMIGMSFIRNAQGLLFFGRMEYTCQSETVTSNESNVASVTVNSTDNNISCWLQPSDTPCTKWKFSSRYYDSTFVSEYSLVCARAYLLAACQASIFVGQTFGNIPFSRIISNCYGRRTVFQLSYAGLLAVSLAMFVIQPLWLNIIARILGGAFGVVAWSALSVLCMELTVPERQNSIGIISALSWPMGAVMAAFAGVYVREWRQLCWMSVAIAAATGIPAALLLPESPRWLVLHRNEVRKAYKTLKSRLKSQPQQQLDDEQRQFPEDGKFLHDLYCRYVVQQLTRQASSQTSTNQLCSILSETRTRSFTLCITAVCVTFIYFGTLIYGSDGLSHNTVHPMLLFAIMSVARAFSYPFFAIIFKKFGCRNTMRCTLSAMCILLLATGFVFVNGYDQFPVLAIAGAAIFVIAHLLSDLCLSAFPAFSGNLYPAGVRPTAITFFQVVARVGSLAAPFAAKLFPDIWSPLPAFAFAIASAIAAVAVFVLPNAINFKEQSCGKQTSDDRIDVELPDSESQQRTHLQI